MPFNTTSPLYSDIIHKSRYARYIPELKRRETWDETVKRLIEYLRQKSGNVSSTTVDSDGVVHNDIYNDLYTAIINLDIVPSMRLMMTAGEACERDNIAAYNCSYLAVNNKRAFPEALYILMNGKICHCKTL